MSAPRSNVMPDFTGRRNAFHYTTALNTLLKMGVDLNKVDLLAVGEYQNYRGEIFEQNPEPDTPLGASTKITLKVGFSSAVDQMPYQFFYGLAGIRASTGKWEDAARCMMAPFDAAVIRNHAFAKFKDLKSNLGLIDYNHLKSFLQLFEFALDRETDDLRESSVWASVYPAFNLWAGSPVLVCRVMKALFGYDFEIRENTPTEHSIPASCQSKLGARSDRLGDGFILGKKFTDYDSGYELLIKNVRQDQVKALLPGGAARKKIERALDTFMPSDLIYRIRVKVRGERTAIGKKEHKNYLGYTSYIGT